MSPPDAIPRGIEAKRLKCAASDEYREKVLFNT